jgi:hypothetical protein
MQTVTSHGKGSQAVDLSLNRAAMSWRRRQGHDERIGRLAAVNQTGVGRDELAAFALRQGDREAVVHIDSSLGRYATSARLFESVIEFQ